MDRATSNPAGATQTESSSSPARWWHDAFGYEIYLRSFADSDGDGIGDLAGITSRLDHLADLGVDLLWITPFYPSPMVDWGYDVADYCDVNPTYGDLGDLDALLDEAHRRGMRVVVDLVPNHSSDRHPWFESARRSREDPYREYYIWADPAPDGGPPNNWVSYFGGPAWTLDEHTGQYWLHLFTPEQPDLNWRNRAVRDEFDAVLRFWLDRGVDGFRIDVAQALVKDALLRSNPQVAPCDPAGERWEQWQAFEHLHDVHQPETLDEVFPRWRAICDEYGALLLGETYVLDVHDLVAMLRGDGLHAGFWFSPMHMSWGADAIRETIARPLALAPDPRAVSWVLSSHDEVRPPTRFGGGDLGRARSLGLSTLLACLPGTPFLYQGEELGLVEGIVPPEAALDPIVSDTTVSRDGCRTPIPWEPGPVFGFSTNPDTWLPEGGRTDADTVAWQRERPDSWLARYRAVVALRRSTPALRSARFEWLDGGAGDVVMLGRWSDDAAGSDPAEVVVALNCADEPRIVEFVGEILFSSVGRTGAVAGAVPLEPAEAIVVAAPPGQAP